MMRHMMTVEDYLNTDQSAQACYFHGWNQELAIIFVHYLQQNRKSRKIVERSIKEFLTERIDWSPYLSGKDTDPSTIDAMSLSKICSIKRLSSNGFLSSTSLGVTMKFRSSPFSLQMR